MSCMQHALTLRRGLYLPRNSVDVHDDTGHALDLYAGHVPARVYRTPYVCVYLYVRRYARALPSPVQRPLATLRLCSYRAQG